MLVETQQMARPQQVAQVARHELERPVHKKKMNWRDQQIVVILFLLSIFLTDVE